MDSSNVNYNSDLHGLEFTVCLDKQTYYVVTKDYFAKSRFSWL